MSQHPFQNFVVRFKRGEPVFSEGEKGKTMFIVQSGQVHLYQHVDGDRQSLGLLEKGDFFGEMSILEGRPRTVTALAEEDAELIEINHSVFDKMIRQYRDRRAYVAQALDPSARDRIPDRGAFGRRDQVSSPGT